MATCAHNSAQGNQPMWASPRKKALVGGKGLRVGKQSLFIPNQKGQLETHTKEPSLWEWTKGCPINFLPPSAWREQCPRAVISVEVKRMKRLHDLPQNCTSSGRGAETKLSKLQQIDAINVKNDQHMIHVPSPWILKGKIWEHVIWRA